MHKHLFMAFLQESSPQKKIQTGILTLFFIELLSKDKQNSEMQLFQVSSLPV